MFDHFVQAIEKIFMKNPSVYWYSGVFAQNFLVGMCNGQRGSTHVRPRGNYFRSLFYLGRYLTGLAELRCKPKRGLPTLLGSGETWDGLGDGLPVQWLHSQLRTLRLEQHTRMHTSHFTCSNTLSFTTHNRPDLTQLMLTARSEDTEGNSQIYNQ